MNSYSKYHGVTGWCDSTEPTEVTGTGSLGVTRPVSVRSQVTGFVHLTAVPHGNSPEIWDIT